MLQVGKRLCWYVLLWSLQSVDWHFCVAFVRHVIILLPSASLFLSLWLVRYFTVFFKMSSSIIEYDWIRKFFEPYHYEHVTTRKASVGHSTYVTIKEQSYWIFDYSGLFAFRWIIKNIPVIAVFFSIVANGIFFFAAHRVDSRFVHGLVGTYEVSCY